MDDDHHLRPPFSRCSTSNSSLSLSNIYAEYEGHDASSSVYSQSIYHANEWEGDEERLRGSPRTSNENSAWFMSPRVMSHRLSDQISGIRFSAHNGEWEVQRLEETVTKVDLEKGLEDIKLVRQMNPPSAIDINAHIV